jgi:hypothetical protein
MTWTQINTHSLEPKHELNYGTSLLLDFKLSMKLWKNIFEHWIKIQNLQVRKLHFSKKLKNRLNFMI